MALVMLYYGGIATSLHAIHESALSVGALFVHRKVKFSGGNHQYAGVTRIFS